MRLSPCTTVSGQKVLPRGGDRRRRIPFAAGVGYGIKGNRTKNKLGYTEDQDDSAGALKFEVVLNNN